MARADLAMYRAKESIGDALCFFETGMDQQVREKRAMALDLRKALANGEFELHYQSQSTITDGEIIGFEALVRWNHPERGLIPPAEFIPLAEETWLIIPLGNWVLRTACATAAAWSEPYRIAVNISPVQFAQGNLPETVHELLLETGLSPSRLELEITESVLVTDLDRALHVLRRLKTLGVTIAMDDFGTGYSSLSNLQSFPFDKIKIDRSFIDNLGRHHQADSIVRAILALGNSLGIPVLAEGIETKAHLDFLRDEGCAEAQGYLLGHPQPIEALFKKFARRKATA
jgi:EAL domain-containing protein (putative c-di-GMP-specific phosphodiesterase class I)